MVGRVWLVCAVPLAAALTTYSLSTHEAPADLTYVNPSDLHTLDPVRMSWTPDFRVALNIWEGLTTWDPRNLEPMEGSALVPPAVSPDGLTYRFTLRHDSRWSNGDAVTALDFVRGWRRGLEPGTAADYLFLLTEHVAGAAEYFRWRSEAVARLTGLQRLRDGRSIDSHQAKAIASLLSPEVLRPLLASTPLQAPDPGSVATPEDIRTRLQNLPIDWPGLYELTFRSHVAEFENRFALVGLQARDENTFVVQLTKPVPYFLDLVALPVFLPCHSSIELLREKNGDAPVTAEGLVVYDPQWTKPHYTRQGYPGLITNGPYRLEDWQFKRRARLTVNPYYRRASSIACRRIDMLVYDSVSAAILAYEAGDVDFLPAMDVPYDHEIARLAQSGKRPDFHLCPTLATYFLSFNCKDAIVAGQPNPFLDRRVRRAFALAVDKKNIVEKVLGRADLVAGSLVPPGLLSGYEPPGGLGADFGEARRLLAEAGFPDGSGVPVVDLLHTARDERVCQAVARTWQKELGVQVRLRPQESKTFAEDKANHRFMIARGNWFADYNDATTFLQCLVTGDGNNDSGYSNPQYDALLAQASVTADATHRAALLQQAESILVERDIPVLPVFHYAVPIAIKPRVVGLYPNARLWFPFQFVKIGP